MKDPDPSQSPVCEGRFCLHKVEVCEGRICLHKVQFVKAFCLHKLAVCEARILPSQSQLDFLKADSAFTNFKFVKAFCLHKLAVCEASSAFTKLSL